MLQDFLHSLERWTPRFVDSEHAIYIRLAKSHKDEQKVKDCEAQRDAVVAKWKDTIREWTVEQPSVRGRVDAGAM